MKASLDQWGCDWREVERLWGALSPAERNDVQQRVNTMGVAATPFHKRLETLINEYKRGNGKNHN